MKPAALSSHPHPHRLPSPVSPLRAASKQKAFTPLKPLPSPPAALPKASHHHHSSIIIVTHHPFRYLGCLTPQAAASVRLTRPKRLSRCLPKPPYSSSSFPKPPASALNCPPAHHLHSDSMPVFSHAEHLHIFSSPHLTSPRALSRNH